MRYVTILLALAIASGTAAESLESQSIRERIGARARERAERAADEAIDKGLDKAEGAIRCAVTDPECIARAQAAGSEVVVTDAGGQPLPEAEQQAAKADASKPGQGIWANFDFVPGERVLWTEDFSGDRVGNFPRRMEFLYGSMEIVEWNGNRYLSAASEDDWVGVKLPEVLPDRFTMEWDMTIPANWESHVFFSMEGIDSPGGGGADGSHIRTPSIYLSSAWAGAKRGSGVEGSQRRIDEVIIDGNNPGGQLVRMRLHVDGSYVKLYVNELRVANIPNLDIPRTDRVYFSLMGQADVPVLIGNISVNAGGRTMYDALTADGRVATQGIYFDTGSDRIRPESSGTLQEIADMLNEHSDLSLTIEGHTDATGNAASNLALSDRRAASVKAALVEGYGIDASRLETAGLGQTKPVATNDTAEGRQSNRRVELVKR